jgi:hypothetical protein
VGYFAILMQPYPVDIFFELFTSRRAGAANVNASGVYHQCAVGVAVPTHVCIVANSLSFVWMDYHIPLHLGCCSLVFIDRLGQPKILQYWPTAFLFDADFDDDVRNGLRKDY